jgi:hypothetical protein
MGEDTLNFFACHLLPPDIERQIAVAAGRIASEIYPKRGQYRPARYEVGERLGRLIRTVKRTAVIYPRIDRYGHIWTGLCRFFLVSSEIKDLFSPTPLTYELS